MVVRCESLGGIRGGMSEHFIVEGKLRIGMKLVKKVLKVSQLNKKKKMELY